MKKSKWPSGVRERIKVFGETYVAIDIHDDVAPGVLMLTYRNRSAKTKYEKDKVHVTTVEDWIAWDRNARKAE